MNALDHFEKWLLPRDACLFYKIVYILRWIVYILMGVENAWLGCITLIGLSWVSWQQGK